VVGGSFTATSAPVNPWPEGRVKGSRVRADRTFVELSLSPQMRVVALVGLLAALALAGGMFFLTRS